MSFLSSSLSSCKVLQEGSFSFEGIEIDSRKALKNKIFFAIKGDRFDGHDFLVPALDKGAKAFIVSDLEKARFLLDHKNISVFLVPDTMKALTELAHEWRKKLQLRVIAITGSSGKTSVCAFTKTLISDFDPYASPKSYNNKIGVSLSLLAVKKPKAILIQEIGTNQPGEIAFLTKLCQPDISALTMVGASHLEGLKNLVGVAKEKKQIYLNSPSAFWIFNKDNPWTKSIANECYELRKSNKEKKILSFSAKGSDVSFQSFPQENKKSLLLKGKISDFEFKKEVPFFTHAENLMCASTIALALGVSPQRIVDLLPECQLPKGRQESFLLKDKKIEIYFDAYNANPSSMAFFFSHLEQLSEGENRFLILGDMKELGGQTEFYHKELASHKVVLQSRVVCFVGEQAVLIEKELKKNNYQGFFKAFESCNEELSEFVKKYGKAQDIIGMKASRSLGLERVFFDITGKRIL